MSLIKRGGSGQHTQVPVCLTDAATPLRLCLPVARLAFSSRPLRDDLTGSSTGSMFYSCYQSDGIIVRSVPPVRLLRLERPKSSPDNPGRTYELIKSGIWLRKLFTQEASSFFNFYSNFSNSFRDFEILL